MIDWVGLLMRGVRFYGHLTGVSNFEIDWQTGRVFTTARSTLYAIVNNVAIVILLGFYLNGRSDFAAGFTKANKLNEYVIIIMSGLRIAAGVITVLTRWRQRSKIKKLVRKVFRLVLAKPQLVRMSRWGILAKFLTGSLTDLLHMAVTVDTMGHVDSSQFVGFCLQYWMATIMTLTLSHHFLVMLFARAQYHLLNMQLRQVIAESRDLSNHPPRRGIFMTRCCYLADQLDEVGIVQSQLQSIIVQLGETFAIQGVVVYFGYYITSVGACYLAYSLMKNGIKAIALTPRAAILLFSWRCFYAVDAIINLFIILKVQDDHKQMTRLLERRTLFASGLDVRLEKSFESLQLQLIRNPLKMEVMKLFPITRGTTTAMFGSLITHSIFLIQYDMEYF